MAFLSQALRRATAWSSRCGREFAGRAVSSASQSRLSGCVAPAGAGVAALSLPLVLCGGAAAWCLSIEEWSVRDLEDPSVEARFAAGGWTRADAGLIKGGVAKNSAIFRAGKGCEIPNFKGSYLGRFPLVSADFWTSDHLSERSRT